MTPGATGRGSEGRGVCIRHGSCNSEAAPDGSLGSALHALQEIRPARIFVQGSEVRVLPQGVVVAPAQSNGFVQSEEGANPPVGGVGRGHGPGFAAGPVAPPDPASLPRSCGRPEHTSSASETTDAGMPGSTP